jgi:hypothetical protein
MSVGVLLRYVVYLFGTASARDGINTSQDCGADNNTFLGRLVLFIGQGLKLYTYYFYKLNKKNISHYLLCKDKIPPHPNRFIPYHPTQDP